jgi:M6 family metalloprotease-like protein
MTQLHGRLTWRWVVAALAGVAQPALAQTDVEALGRARGGARPPASYYEILARNPDAFQFSPNNGWVRRGRAVGALRVRARGQAAAGAAFLPAFGAPEAALTGTLNVPVFLVLFKNTDSVETVGFLPRGTMEARLYGTHTAPPYSIHTYYREISNDQLIVNGLVFDWRRVSQPDTFYEGDNQGLLGQVPTLVREIALLHDDTVNFGMFDNDGPDGIPNSGDDDGYIDAVVVLHPEVDGSCRSVNSSATRNIWAHRWSTTGTTNDPAAAPGVEFIQIRDYIIQGGQGGDTGCASNQPQAMGVVAHETGHLFGLPDLYDTRSNGGAGIGRWGIMGSGNFQRPHRPAHMEAWSRAELGWITEVLVPRDTTLVLNPVEVSDTAFVLPIPESSEYFLLENRQPIGSDSLIIAPGLLIWHVDSALIRSRLRFNSVNSASPYGLALEQADGHNALELSTTNTGDAGDPWPGSSVNLKFSKTTTPSSVRNTGAPSYVTVDSIAQLTPFGAMRAVVRIGQRTLIAATDTIAQFRLDGVERGRYFDVLDPDSSHTLEMDSVQLRRNDTHRYTWLAWSNGQPRSHTLSPGSQQDTIIATVKAEYRLKVDLSGAGGTVASNPAVDHGAGVFLDSGMVVTLTASVTGAGVQFDGWGGSVDSASPEITLTMSRAFQVTAWFVEPLSVTTASLPSAVMGAIYQQPLTATGGRGTYSWRLVSGALPPGVALGSLGVVGGRPQQTGAFAFQAEATSGSQADTVSLVLNVGAPALTESLILPQLLQTANTLTADEVLYMDLLGNRNGKLDLGDFLAWLQTLPSATAPAALPGREQDP